MLRSFKVMLTICEHYAIIIQKNRITISDEKFPTVELTAYSGRQMGRRSKNDQKAEYKGASGGVIA